MSRLFECLEPEFQLSTTMYLIGKENALKDSYIEAFPKCSNHKIIPQYHMIKRRSSTMSQLVDSHLLCTRLL